MDKFLPKVNVRKKTVRQQVVVKVRALGPSVQILNKNKKEDLILAVSEMGCGKLPGR